MICKKNRYDLLRRAGDTPHARLLRSEAGFSLLEAIVSITITAVIAGVISRVLVSGVDTYRFVESRKQALQAGRLGVQRITRELRQITNSASLLVATQDSIRFYKKNQELVTIAYNQDRIMLNGYPLVQDVSRFEFSYFDSEKKQLDAPVANPADVYQIKFELEVQRNGRTVTLFNEIRPRNF